MTYFLTKHLSIAKGTTDLRVECPCFDKKYWKVKENIEKLLSSCCCILASCCKAMSCHQPILNTLFNINTSNIDNIKKF